MTGPQDPGPGGADWEFPPVEPAEPAPPSSPGAYDTGSDAWWRAQVDRLGEPAAPPQVPPTPLDPGWLPPELARPYEATAPAPAQPDRDEVAEPLPVPARSSTAPSRRQSKIRPSAALGVVAAAAVPRVPAAASSTEVAYDPAVAARGRRRRAAAPGGGGGAGRALAGAAIAVAGVCIAIAAFLWLGDDPQSGSPAVGPAPGSTLAGGGPTIVGTPARPTATTAPTATATPTAAATPRGTPTVSPRVIPKQGAPPVVAPAPQPAPRPTLRVVGPTPMVVPPSRPAPAPILPVTVLNNSRYRDLAERSAARFRAGGWPTPVIGNFTGRIRATTVYYEPGQAASAQRFAKQFGIDRVLPRFRGLPGHGLTVVLTKDYV